jgi:hypothetical protein
VRSYERATPCLTRNRQVEDWGKLLGDTAASASGSTACSTTATSSSAARTAGDVQIGVERSNRRV